MTGFDVEAYRREGSWLTLMGIAADMVRNAESLADGVEMGPLLGGGIRLMLRYGHRISDDIDLFLSDAQWINRLTPRLHDHPGEMVDYVEQSNFVKIHFPFGEIDFIVAPTLFDLGPDHDESSLFGLEPVKEVIGKKLLYRGLSLTSRDLFDLWTVIRSSPEEFSSRDLGVLLGDRLPKIIRHVEGMATYRVNEAAWHGLRANDIPSLSSVVAWAVDWLNSGLGHCGTPATKRRKSASAPSMSPPSESIADEP